MAKQAVKIIVNVQNMKLNDLGGASLYVETHKLNANKLSELMANIGDNMTLIVGEIDVDPDEGKSSSERLRGILYKIWELNPNGQTFQQYYSAKMEQIIKHFIKKFNGDDR